jgi:DNA-directed RNA polymerase specialized sigma24 family protein
MTGDRLVIGTAVLRGNTNTGAAPDGERASARRGDERRQSPASEATAAAPAGPAPYEPGTPLSNEWRQDIVRRYTAAEESITAIAAAIGCSYGTVHTVLTRAQVPLRSRGGARSRDRANR